MKINLGLFVANHSSFCSHEVIGYTESGNSIDVYRIGTNNSKKILITSDLHGNEAECSHTAYYFAIWLLNGSANAQEILGKAEIDIIPNIDNDNWDIERKNINGVDLNRNFAYGFGSGSSNPDDYDYRGTSALSENESKAIHDFFISDLPDIHINLHWYASGYVMWKTYSYNNASKSLAIYNQYLNISTIEDYATWGKSTSVYPSGFAIDDSAYYSHTTSFLIEECREYPYDQDLHINDLKFRLSAFVLASAQIEYVASSETPPENETTPILSPTLAESVLPLVVSISMLSSCIALISRRKR
jgi:hypothetical protein